MLNEALSSMGVEDEENQLETERSKQKGNDLNFEDNRKLQGVASLVIDNSKADDNTGSRQASK